MSSRHWCRSLPRSGSTIPTPSAITIEEIAWHKAGIIKPVTPVVAAVSDRTALQVIAGEASTQGADLHRIIPTQGDFRRTNEATARLAVELLGFDVETGRYRRRVGTRTASGTDRNHAGDRRW